MPSAQEIGNRQTAVVEKYKTVLINNKLEFSQTKGNKDCYLT